MYCDGTCDWNEPAVLIPVSILLTVTLIVAYGIYRLVRWVQRNRQPSPTWWAGAVLVVIVAIAATTVVLRNDTRAPLLDRDCPEGTHYPVALTIETGKGQNDLALVSMERELKRLTRDLSSFDPSFSPDGEELAYTQGYGYTSGGGGGFANQGISIMGIDGSDQRVLTADHLDYEPAWSPNGDEIAFARWDIGLLVVPVEGGEPRVLIQADEPEPPYLIERDRPHLPHWSADGERIAYLAGGPDSGIFVVDAEGGKPSAIATDLGSVEDMTWSPDGRTFAYQGSGGIFTIGVDEANPRRWMKGVSGPEFSPDGEHLMYLNRERPSIFMMEAVEQGVTAYPLIGRQLPVSFTQRADWLDCT